MAQNPENLDDETAGGVKSIVFVSLFLLVVGGCSAMGAQAAIADPSGVDITTPQSEELSVEQRSAHSDLTHLVQSDPRQDPLGYSSLLVAAMSLLASFGLSTRRTFGLWLARQTLVALALLAVASLASRVVHMFDIRPDLEVAYARAQEVGLPGLPGSVGDYYGVLIGSSVIQSIVWVGMVLYAFVILRRPGTAAAWKYMLSLREGR